MADVNTLTIEEIEAAAAADEILEINTETRVIDVPVNYEFGVFNDKDVKTIYFKVPKTYNAVDLNDFQIRMVYMNASNEGNEYIVTNRLVYGSYLYFTWLLGRDLFKGEGKVRFIVCMRKFNSDGTTNKEFNTTIARGTVLGGLEVDDPTAEKYNLVAEINSMEALLECEEIQETVEAKAAETDATYQRMQELSATFGSPLVAATAAEMTNGSRVYVYVGNETGYTAGHWYYSDGSQWNDGGVYQSAGVALDTTLSVADKAADAKAVGDAITAEQTARTNADTALQTSLQTAIDNEATARTNAVNDVKSDLSVLNTKVVINHSETVVKDASAYYTFEKPIPDGTLVKITNNSSDTIFSVNFIDADGTTQSMSAGVPYGDSVKVTAPFRVVQMRSYCSNVNWEFTVEYGVNITEQADITQKLINVSELNVENTDFGFTIGTLGPGTGAESVSTTRIRSEFIRLGKGSIIELDEFYSANCLIVYEYNENKQYLSDSAWGDGNIYTMKNDGYARVLIRKSPDGTITDSEVATLADKLTIYRNIPQSLINDTADMFAMDEIPSYFESQVSTALGTIKSNIIDTGINGDSFAFITDLHWQSNAKNSPKLMKTVVNNTDVGKVICGGDLIGGGAKSIQMAIMGECVESFKDIQRFYVLFGNHDTNTIGSTASDHFTKSEVYGINQKHTDFVMNYGVPCYFSFDNPTTKTRYICLDTGLEGSELETAQREWLNATLASMPTNYHALVFAHIIYQTTTTWHVGLQPSELQITSFMSAVSVILDTFNDNNSDKKVEAIFGGHAHIDGNFSTTGGIPIVLIDCDARQTFTETSTGSGTANHALGTINEQCFDVVTVDYSTKTIKCVRIGRGADRTITY